MFIEKMKNFTRYLILFFFVIFTNNTRAEFFEDLSKIIENNKKRLSYGISVTDFNMDGKYEFLVTGFGYPNLALSFQDGKLKNLNQQKIFSDTLKKGSISFSKGTFWGAVSGFTSFGIHAGGLPFNIYMLPQKLDHRVYVGTAALFFGIVNFIKLYPYYLLDQLRIENITIALLLMPFAPIGFYIGYKLTQRIDGERFYSLTYACLLLIGLKLLNDGM